MYNKDLYTRIIQKGQNSQQQVEGEQYTLIRNKGPLGSYLDTITRDYNRNNPSLYDNRQSTPSHVRLVNFNNDSNKTINEPQRKELQKKQIQIYIPEKQEQNTPQTTRTLSKASVYNNIPSGRSNVDKFLPESKKVLAKLMNNITNSENIQTKIPNASNRSFFNQTNQTLNQSKQPSFEQKMQSIQSSTGQNWQFRPQLSSSKSQLGDTQFEQNNQFSTKSSRASLNFGDTQTIHHRQVNAQRQVRNYNPDSEKSTLNYQSQKTTLKEDITNEKYQQFQIDLYQMQLSNQEQNTKQNKYFISRLKDMQNDNEIQNASHQTHRSMLEHQLNQKDQELAQSNRDFVDYKNEFQKHETRRLQDQKDSQQEVKKTQTLLKQAYNQQREQKIMANHLQQNAQKQYQKEIDTANQTNKILTKNNEERQINDSNTIRELREQLEQAQQEKLVSHIRHQNDKLCQICCTREISYTASPCGHVYCDGECKARIESCKKCFKCRQRVTKMQKIYF